MPPSAPPLLGRCTDDPTYTDAGWTCTSWAGYPCGYGGWGVDTAAQVAALQLACPVSCSDVTPVCVPPPPPRPRRHEASVPRARTERAHDTRGTTHHTTHHTICLRVGRAVAVAVDARVRHSRARKRQAHSEGRTRGGKGHLESVLV